MIERRLLLVAAWLGLIGPGCLAANPYTTAKTLAPGEMSHTVGISAFVFVDSDAKTTPSPIPAPSYAFRMGVHEYLDFGAQFYGPSAGRFDLKVNPLRFEHFALAVDPSLWVGTFSTTNSASEGNFATTFDLPVIAELSFGRVSIIPWAGPGYLWVPQLGSGGTIIRTGFGVQIRADRVTIHPEISFVLDPSRGDYIDFTYGIGFGFGDRPK